MCSAQILAFISLSLKTQILFRGKRSLDIIIIITIVIIINIITIIIIIIIIIVILITAKIPTLVYPVLIHIFYQI